jgi:hypothetical protein
MPELARKEVHVGLVRRGIGLFFRTLATVFMLVVVLVAVLWVRSEWQSRRLERLVAVTKQWPTTVIGKDSMPVDVKTRCSESRLYYIVRMSRPLPFAKASEPSGKLLDASGKDEVKLPARGTQPTDDQWATRTRMGVEKIILQFLDKDGFVVLSHELSVAGFTSVREERIIDHLESNGSTHCDRAAFARAESLSIMWFDRR